MLEKKNVSLSLTVFVLVLIYCYYKAFVFSSNSVYHTLYEYPQIMPYWKNISNSSIKSSTTRELTLKESSAKKSQVWMKQMEAKHSKVIENIERICRKYKKDNSTEIPLKSLMVDPKHHLAYCRNAKVGSTTWFHYFDMLVPEINTTMERIWTERWLGGKNRRKLIRIFNANKIFEHSWINRSSYDEFAKNNNLTTFTFVRHPFERIVSAYNSKIVNSTKMKYREFEYKSFPDFVERGVLRELESEKESRVNIHWKPFIDRCHHCSIPYTVIGRIETFQEDFEYIVRKNNLEEVFDLKNNPLFHSPNSSKKDTKKETMKYFLQLNISQIQRLYNAYKIDFELFGYDIDVNQNYP